ncbi:MAG: hypothetical protein ABEJ70_07155 [Halobacteriaceae archaeon]
MVGPALVVAPTAGSPIAFAGTFLVTAVFFSLTGHVAARYVLGDVPATRALALGVPLAVVAVALVRRHPLVVLAVAAAVDLGAAHLAYRLRFRTAALVVVVHVTVTVLSSLVLAWVLAVLRTAPV